jgi:uroporphyrinogen III methyltransferase/synthase
MSDQVAEKLPLAGRRILITRSPEQAGDFAALLREQGAEVIQVPLIRFDPPDSWEAADRAIDRIDAYSLVLFTSSNAVDFFLRRLRARGVPPGALSRATLAAIGPKTARELEKNGLPVRLIPERFVAEGLLESLEGDGVEGKEVLIPRAQEAREVLVEELERKGARVTVAPVYRTVPARENRELLVSSLRDGVDMVTFTASSTVRHFLDLLGSEAIRLTRGVRVACIGQITGETARAGGLSPDVVPERSTVADLATAIREYYSLASHR